MAAEIVVFIVISLRSSRCFNEAAANGRGNQIAVETGRVRTRPLQ